MGGVRISHCRSLPQGNLSLGKIFFMEEFPKQMSSLGGFFLVKNFPRGYFSPSDLIEQILSGMCYAPKKDVTREWMLKPMNTIKNI